MSAAWIASFTTWRDAVEELDAFLSSVPVHQPSLRWSIRRDAATGYWRVWQFDITEPSA